MGDKLGLITQMAAWLCSDGRMMGHLDLEVGAVRRRVPRLMRAAGLSYDRRMVRCEGGRGVHFSVIYPGTDDHNGPNYTGQPAVCEVYRVVG